MSEDERPPCLTEWQPEERRPWRRQVWAPPGPYLRSITTSLILTTQCMMSESEKSVSLDRTTNVQAGGLKILQKPPESPTTARELDFDDEPHETPASPQPRAPSPKQASAADQPAPGSGEDVPPPKPPRPGNPTRQAESTLKEAFPNIDVAVIKAVLQASGGSVEPAFNALLGSHHHSRFEASISDTSQACQTQTRKQNQPLHQNHHGQRSLP